MLEERRRRVQPACLDYIRPMVGFSFEYTIDYKNIAGDKDKVVKLWSKKPQDFDRIGVKYHNGYSAPEEGGQASGLPDPKSNTGYATLINSMKI